MHGAVGSDDGVIRMCMTSMPQYTSLKSHEDSILTLAFDPKGEFFASSSDLTEARVRDSELLDLRQIAEDHAEDHTEDHAIIFNR